MSKADALLNSLHGGIDESVVTGGNIVIGKDRFITVPESLKRIAVQYDHNVETVTFDCPRYWDEHDMSTMTVYVNYIRSDGMLGLHRCTNVTVDIFDSNVMHFDWVISGNVTEVSGPMAFLVCIKKTNADGEEENHWNSELCTDLYVSEGLKCQETILRRYPDIITTLLMRMDEVTEFMQAVIDSGTHGHDNLDILSGITNEVIGGWNSKARLFISSSKPETITENDLWFKLDGTGSTGVLTHVDRSGNETPLYPDIVIDETLTAAGEAADARAVGVALSNLNTSLLNAVSSLNQNLRSMIDTAQSTANAALSRANDTYTRNETTTAFVELEDRLSDKIGDIKITRRTDLGDNWLLCNGAEISESEYPEVYAMYRETMSAVKEEQTGGVESINGIVYHNGRWIAYGSSLENGDNYPIIFTTTNLKSWYKYKLDSTYEVEIHDIAYNNGTWVAVGCTSSAHPYVYVTTTPTGSWTRISLDGYTEVKAIMYHDGVWLIAGNDDDNSHPVIYYTTTPSGTWTRKEISTSTDTIYDVGYFNGVWVIGAYGYVYTSTVPGDAWTRRPLPASGTILNLTIAGNKLVILTGSSNRLTIFETTNATGEWTANTYTLPIPTSKTSISICDAVYHDGSWFVMGSQGSNYTTAIFTATDAKRDWTVYHDYDNSNRLSNGYICCYGNSVMAVSDYDSDFRVSRTISYLPVVSIDRSYAYIKAKED